MYSSPICASAALSVVLGGMLALARLSSSWLLSSLAWAYIWLFRSLPLIVVLIILYNFSYLYDTLSLGVLQRTRELGLLRALGFTGRQVRAMVMAESVQMTLAALGLGLVLGTFYGWVAAQSLVGSQVGLMPPTLPWLVLAGVVLFGAALALGAAIAPARRAIRVSPVAALAID